MSPVQQRHQPTQTARTRSQGTLTDKDGTHGFVLSKGVFTTVNVPGAAFTQINGINAPGRFAGTYSNTPQARATLITTRKDSFFKQG